MTVHTVSIITAHFSITLSVMNAEKRRLSLRKQAGGKRMRLVVCYGKALDSFFYTKYVFADFILQSVAEFFETSCLFSADSRLLSTVLLSLPSAPLCLLLRSITFPPHGHILNSIKTFQCANTRHNILRCSQSNKNYAIHTRSMWRPTGRMSSFKFKRLCGGVSPTTQHTLAESCSGCSRTRN